jgi:hypothetical protein
MRVNRSAAAGLATVIAVAVLHSATPSPGAVPGTGAQSRLPLQPLGVRGEAIWPAFEGWGPDKRDGTNLILIGYNNRNADQAMDIPIGPNNRIEPGGPDHGQPTHFLTGRQWGVFAVAVPKDFGTRRLRWTLTANGHVSVVQFWLNPPYWINFYRHPATLNEPPVVRFSPDGPELTGPPRGTARTLSATVNQPVRLTLWVTDEPSKTVFDPRAAFSVADPAHGGADDLRGAGGGGGIRGGGSGRGGGSRPDVVVIWTKYRGPGWVSIDDERLELRNGGDPKAIMQAETEAWFGQPGEYWLRAQVNDSSGDGGRGEQCCWTNAQIKVNVR